MNDEQTQAQLTAEELAELEREIRNDRKFSLEEAILRLVEPGSLKDASPATRKQQAEAVLEDYLRRHLPDSSESLPLVLSRYVKESALLLENLDQPFVALVAFVQRILSSDYVLEEFVREVDVHWGRVMCERPYFEIKGSPPHPDDPYTRDSVRQRLLKLVADLKAGQT